MLNHQGGLSHGATATKSELLGILIKLNLNTLSPINRPAENAVQYNC